MKSNLQEEPITRETLDNLILSVKSDIAKIDGLNDYRKKLLLADVETRIRLIGAKIEKMTLVQMGILDNSNDNIYQKYSFSQNMHFNYSIVRQKIENLKRESSNNIIKIINSQDNIENNKEYTNQSIYIEMCDHFLEELSLLEANKIKEPSYDLKYFIFGLFPEVSPHIPIEEVSSIIRRNYLITLSKIRVMGGDFDIKSYHNDAVLKRNIFSNKSKELESKASELKALEGFQSFLLFPNDWIKASNNSLPLFLNKSNKREKGIKVIPEGKQGGHYNHEADYFKGLPKEHSEIVAFMEIDIGLIVHELGHRFVKLFPIIGELENIFYIRRTTSKEGLRTEQIENTDKRIGEFLHSHMATDPYLRRERFRKNAIDQYKLKKNKIEISQLFDKVWTLEECNEAFELFSTGLESILFGLQGTLAGLWTEQTKDDELRHFILGILATV